MKVLFATGGSGGHIFPALQTALELKKRGHEVLFAGALGMAQDKIEAAGFNCRAIGAQGFKDRSPWGVLCFSFSMARAFAQSIGIVRRAAPDKIVGFGGYGAFSIMLAGILLGRRTMIHEQNVLPGKANRILGPWVKKIAVSFKDSLEYFSSGKTVWTGCPCHDRRPSRCRQEILSAFGLKPQGKIIALLGGSQGSRRLNEVFFEAMQVLTRRGGMQAVHMTGKNDHAVYAQKYKESGMPVVVSAFISPVEELYAAADVMVSRAGAATVSELGAFAVPAVLVPYPFAGHHQKHNALVPARVFAAILIEQDHLTVESLVHAIDRCLGEDFTRARIHEKTKGSFVKDAALRLADAVEQI
ncbi:MAG: UDP-N-acetylglucosamine--N-acetylmuramyl-(pentapeptide) pyrophosphoryl-undecaprenol N-acetylglucosamine transferase [Candidatus Omnitrophica bacterium]|nr:UDP-N-acetylglucosamine--N-acetylmuramyl-(pentapeptide) pyrophosphoryl-undecaprenol N-acetylglucosamine transferase [Candidatus Omnitrophota bacterium]